MADTQQGLRQQGARDAAGTLETYDGDLRALFEAQATIPAGSTFNDAFIAWLQDVTGSTEGNINDLAQLFVEQTAPGTYNWSSLGELGLPTLFAWKPETAEALPDTATFTRASVAQVLTTTDGTTFWYQEAKSGELRLDGLRRVEQRISNVDWSGGTTPTGWTTPGVTGTRSVATSTGPGANAIQFVASTERPFLESPTVSVRKGESYTISCYVEAIDTAPSGSTPVLAASGTASWTTVERDNLTAEAVGGFYSAVFTCTVSGDGTFRLGLGVSGNAIGDVTLSSPQVQLLQNSDDVFGGWVNDTVTYNAEVAGVRYYNTANANTRAATTGIITEATGTTITGGGYLPEPAATNNVVDSSDYNAVSWTQGGLSAMNDDGVNNIGLRQHTMIADGGGGSHRIFDSAVNAKDGYFILKQSSTNPIRFVTVSVSPAGADYAAFDLQLASITEEANGTGLITDLGDGFYKCEFTNDAAAASQFLILSMSDTGTPGLASPAFTGAAEELLICHAQAEVTAFSTSPIVTSGSTVTRVADTITDTTLFTTDWMWLVDVTNPLVLSSTRTMASGPSPSSYSINGSSQLLLSDQGGIPTGSVNSLTAQEGLRAKYLASYDNTNNVIFNGTDGDMQQSADASEDWAGLNNHRIGGRTGATQYLGRMHNYVLYGVAAEDLAQAEDLVA